MTNNTVDNLLLNKTNTLENLKNNIKIPSKYNHYKHFIEDALDDIFQTNPKLIEFTPENLVIKIINDKGIDEAAAFFHEEDCTINIQLASMLYASQMDNLRIEQALRHELLHAVQCVKNQLFIEDSFKMNPVYNIISEKLMEAEAYVNDLEMIRRNINAFKFNGVVPEEKDLYFYKKQVTHHYQKTKNLKDYDYIKHAQHDYMMQLLTNPINFDQKRWHKQYDQQSFDLYLLNVFNKIETGDLSQQFDINYPNDFNVIIKKLYNDYCFTDLDIKKMETATQNDIKSTCADMIIKTVNETAVTNTDKDKKLIHITDFAYIAESVCELFINTTYPRDKIKQQGLKFINNLQKWQQTPIKPVQFNNEQINFYGMPILPKKQENTLNNLKKSVIHKGFYVSKKDIYYKKIAAALDNINIDYPNLIKNSHPNFIINLADEETEKTLHESNQYMHYKNGNFGKDGFFDISIEMVAAYNIDDLSLVLQNGLFQNIQDTQGKFIHGSLQELLFNEMMRMNQVDKFMKKQQKSLPSIKLPRKIKKQQKSKIHKKTNVYFNHETFFNTCVHNQHMICTKSNPYFIEKMSKLYHYSTQQIKAIYKDMIINSFDAELENIALTLSLSYSNKNLDIYKIKSFVDVLFDAREKPLNTPLKKQQFSCHILNDITNINQNLMQNSCSHSDIIAKQVSKANTPLQRNYFAKYSLKMNKAKQRF